MTKTRRTHILQVGSNEIVCRDVEASDGVSIRTLVESCMRVKRFPQADVGENPKENAAAELWIQSSVFLWKDCRNVSAYRSRQKVGTTK